MKKLLKVAGVAAATLAGLLVILFAVAKSISDDQYKSWITTAVESATGRSFSIGTLELGIGSRLSVRAAEVSLANAKWAGPRDMLKVDRLEAELRLWPLLRGVADLRAAAGNIDVVAQTGEDGASNWAIGGEEPGRQQPVEDRKVGGLPLRPLIREFSIQDLNVSIIDPHGVDKTVTIDDLWVESLRDLELRLTGQYDAMPLALSGSLGRVEDLMDNVSTPVRLDGRVGGSKLGVSGAWGHLQPALTADLAIDLDVPSTAELASVAGLEGADLGAVKCSATISAAEGNAALRDIHANLQGELANASVQGSISSLMPLEGFELQARADTADLENLLKRLGVGLPTALPPAVHASGRVVGGLDRLSVNDVVLDVSDEGLKATLSGSVAHALAPEGVAVRVEARAESVAALSKYAGVELPDLGAIDVTADVSSADETYRLANLRAALSGDDINIEVTGAVADLTAVEGIGADIRAEITDGALSALEAFSKQFDVPVPIEMLPASARLNAHVAGGLNELGIIDLAGEIRDAGVEVALSGRIGDVLTLQGVDATLAATADSTRALSKYAGRELPDLGSLSVAGRLLSSGERLALNDVGVELKGPDVSLHLEGGVGDLLALTGVNADFSGSVSSLSLLSDAANADLPATDPVTVQGKVSSGEDEAVSKTIFQVSVETGRAKASVDGSLSNVRSLENVDVEVAVMAPALSDFSKLTQRRLPDQGPFSLTGRIRTLPDEYRLDDFRLTVDQQEARGRIGMKTADAGAGRSTIEGSLHIPYLDLTPLLTAGEEPDGSGEQGADTSAQSASGSKKGDDVTSDVKTAGRDAEAAAELLFSTDPLPFDLLHQYDAELELTADYIKAGESDLTDLILTLSLEDSVLAITPIKSRAGKGTLEGRVEVDGHISPTKLSLFIDIEDAPMPRLGGALDFGLKLDGAGDSMAELMGSLNGEVLIVATDGRLERSFMTAFGSDLINSINPFAKDEEYTTLECGILRMDIDDGIADFNDKLAAQLTKTTWRGGGEINLKTEELDVGVAPKARKGMGISAGTLANLVHVGGTLANPAVRLNPKDVAVKYGKYLAAVSTGGLSLLAEGLLNRSQANIDVCEQIRAGTVFGGSAEKSGE